MKLRLSAQFQTASGSNQTLGTPKVMSQKVAESGHLCTRFLQRLLTIAI